MRIYILFLFAVFLTSCKQEGASSQKKLVDLLGFEVSKQIDIAPPKTLSLPSYPWEKEPSYLTALTEDFLSCRGYLLHSPQKELKNGSYQFVYDCDGGELPEETAFLSLLLEELAALQTSFKKKIVVTSGYRCQKHLHYCLASKALLQDSIKKGKSATFFLEGVDLFDQKSLEALSSYKQIAQTLWKKKGFSLELIPPYGQNDPDNIHPYPYFLLSIE